MIDFEPLRKKEGGINIKKIFFLITLFGISLMSILNVNAETATFYEGEYIDNIYMSKYQYSTNTIYYQKARFFRKSGTNEFAYCIEPFSFFNENSTYESVLNPYNLSQEQKQRIERIAHFGYGYKNHTEVKWYAITQMMIWETADPSSGKFYFTDTLNGNKIYPYQNEINEINDLVNTYDELPSFNNKNYDLVEGKELVIDGGNMMKYYSTNDNLTVSYSHIIIKNLKEGTYKYTFYRDDNVGNHPSIFYQSNNSQNLIQTGSIENKYASFTLNVHKTGINIKKLDFDTKSTEPQGEASLDGTKIQILDQMKHCIKELTIENNEAAIENIYFGTYYIKEIEPGKGYTLDEELHEVTISKDENIKDITIYNKVIEKNIKIIKKYGNNNQFIPEPNIDFDIYHDNILIKTVSTDNNGEVSFTLPYGTYQIIQKNSSKGYTMVDPFTIEVNEDNYKDEIIELKDYKIPVPNTHSDRSFTIQLVIYILSLLL